MRGETSHSSGMPFWLQSRDAPVAMSQSSGAPLRLQSFSTSSHSSGTPSELQSRLWPCSMSTLSSIPFLLQSEAGRGSPPKRPGDTRRGRTTRFHEKVRQGIDDIFVRSKQEFLNRSEERRVGKEWRSQW